MGLRKLWELVGIGTDRRGEPLAAAAGGRRRSEFVHARVEEIDPVARTVRAAARPLASRLPRRGAGRPAAPGPRARSDRACLRRLGAGPACRPPGPRSRRSSAAASPSSSPAVRTHARRRRTSARCSWTSDCASVASESVLSSSCRRFSRCCCRTSAGRDRSGSANSSRLAVSTPGSVTRWNGSRAAASCTRTASSRPIW